MSADGVVVGSPGIGTIFQLWNMARTTPDGNRTIERQIALARDAGFTGDRAQLIAVGQGLMSREAFAAGQGGGPGADRIGPTVADRAGGFPTSIPLPNIPGLPSSIPLPPILGLPLPVILGPVIAGGLFWPTAAGQGSDLRGMYGMPVPKTGTTRKPGRRARARKRTKIPNPWSPPRTRTKIPNPWAPAKGRGGPVTISRPNARALPPAIAVPAKFPRPSVLTPGAGVKINTGPIKVATPARIPQTRAQQAAAIARLPIVSDLLRSIAGAGIASLFASPAAQLGRITLPNTGPANQPLPMPQANLATNPLAWSYAVPRTAAQATEQDCSCRPARKKSKKKACKNPVTSRRSFKRGSKRFVTTTKEMKCQA